MSLSSIKLELIKLLRGKRMVNIEEAARILNVKTDTLRAVIEEFKKIGLIEISRVTKKWMEPGNKLIELGTLPEFIILDRLSNIGLNEIKLRDLFKLVNLPKEDAQVGIGKLVERGYLSIVKKNGERVVVIKRLDLDNEFRTIRNILNTLLSLKSIDIPSKEFEFLSRFNIIRRPGFIKVNSRTYEYIRALPKINEVELKSGEEITLLTPEIIKSDVWRYARFKEYDLNIKTFEVYPGRIHPMRELIREVAEIFESMGFEEAYGPIVEISFRNFDMLFQPQDHPARDMQDTFYLEDPEYGDINYPSELIDKIKRVHEDGWKTGSIGWGDKWDLHNARRLILRTHTTAVTIKRLYEIGNREARVFAIGKVFRNETVDFKHLPEFMQVDGIVISKRANLRMLMGVIRDFYAKLGFKNVKFWPSYFPYTEPSIQPSIYVEKWSKWLELGGAGIFRPEVTYPLGVTYPVLAWGLGLERLLMIKYDLDDIRLIYANDLGWLRRRSLK